MMPITLLVARRIQCSDNHDKSPRIDLDKANHVFGWFWPYSKPTFAFFTITLSHSVKAPEHDAHHFACGKENPMQPQP
jgi:hypothetical protein